jgi:kynureninase
MNDFNGLREQFHIPKHASGSDTHYFCGNSLGLMPKTAHAEVLCVLQAWADEGVEGHFKGDSPWMPYHEFLREDLAELVGAKPIEVVAMNSLSVNLHLLLTSFYRPSKTRFKILLEARAFPSDRYALESQVKLHGLDPGIALIELAPEPGADLLDVAQIQHAIAEAGESLALVLFPGVQYVSGQYFDLAAISAAAHAVGAIAGFDLAHAAGNIDLQLHASGADFAVWCSYKYLNAGPGAVAGAFVHERHAQTDRPRLAGWWGHDKNTRFLMGPDFQPTPGADGWQLSNPPILALAPLRASLRHFSAAGMANLRARSVFLTGLLERQLQSHFAEHLSQITPSDPAQRGSQLSVRVRAGRDAGRACLQALATQGIICDWREPDVIRISPTALYNTAQDIDALILALQTHFSAVT